MGKMDALRFRSQSEQMPVTVEAPGLAFFDDFEPRFVVPVEQLIRDFSACILVGQLNRFGAVSLNGYDGDCTVRQNPAEGRVGL